MAVSGTFKIAELAAKIERLGSAEFRAEVSRKMAAEATKLVADGFRGSVDPYGQSWEALKSRTGKPLLDTGRLRASFAPTEVTPNGFKLTSTVDYAAAQNYGHVYPARSEMKPRTVWAELDTGKFISKKTKKTAVAEHTFHATFGERKLPARPMVPEQSKGLDKWEAPLKRIATRAVKEAVK